MNEIISEYKVKLSRRRSEDRVWRRYSRREWRRDGRAGIGLKLMVTILGGYLEVTVGVYDEVGR
jgi:hypothetical protein